MFGINYIDDYTHKEVFEWYPTKEQAIKAALQAKENCCSVKDLITDIEYLERWITFIVSYSYEEIESLF